jgi:hypothetical protein
VLNTVLLFSEYVEASGGLLPCAEQEIEELYREITTM